MDTKNQEQSQSPNPSSGGSSSIPRTGNKVDPIFQVHQLNEVGIRKATDVARTLDNCLNTLSDICRDEQGNVPQNREWSIVKTKLEEASFFAKKSMANVKSNQLSKAA